MNNFDNENYHKNIIEERNANGDKSIRHIEWCNANGNYGNGDCNCGRWKSEEIDRELLKAAKEMRAEIARTHRGVIATAWNQAIAKAEGK